MLPPESAFQVCIIARASMVGERGTSAERGTGGSGLTSCATGYASANEGVDSRQKVVHPIK